MRYVQTSVRHCIRIRSVCESMQLKMCKMFKLALVWLVSVVQLTKCAHIFAYFPIPSYSHQMVYQPIWRALALRGHQVTVLTPHPLNQYVTPNMTEYDLSSSIPLHRIQEKMATHLTIMDNYISLYTIMRDIIDHQMAILNGSTILQTISNVDLVLMEPCYPASYAFAAHFRVPIVAISSLDLFPQVHQASGSIFWHPVIYPNFFAYTITQNMGLGQRIGNVAFDVWFRLWYRFWVLPDALKTVRKHFPNIGDNTLIDTEHNISLLLQNVNVAIHGPRAFGPFVQIGFTHIKEHNQLPEDLQSILDSATNGVIYVSLGSNIKSANLHAGMRNKFIAVFRKLPYTILWKWESENIRDQPQNVHTRKWLPQQDVLRHPNIRAFVTQGGLQSLEEAIYYTVPVVGLPFIADQPMNVQKIDYLGAGIHINPHNFEVDQLFEAVMAVAEDDKYRNKMKELRDVCLDQPETGLERAIWWIEYVIRHKGARYLRSPLADMPLYQYLMLDVLAVFVSTILLTSLIGLWLIRTCCRYFAQSKLMRDSNRSSDTLKPVINKKYTMHTKEETNFKNITAEGKNSRRKFD